MGKKYEMPKIQRKKLQEEEKIFADEIQRLIELAMEDDRWKFHELETEKADEVVWLMKCPPRVAKAWRDVSATSGSFLAAKHIESVDLLLPDFSPELTMEMVSGELWNISKLFLLNKSNCFGLIFSETNQGKVAVEGTVTHKFYLRPYSVAEEYGQVFRERTKKQTKVTKELKRCVRRTRGDRSEVEAKIFELYERQPKWTMKQLTRETNQPVRFVKEILRELCVYNVRGGQGTYQLKPEYKRIGKEGS